MDKNCYGSSKAAINLADMVTAHPKSTVIKRKVGRLFESTFETLNELESMKNRRSVAKLYPLLINDLIAGHLNFLDDSNPLELKIKTHIHNVIKGRHSAWLRGERTSRKTKKTKSQ